MSTNTNPDIPTGFLECPHCHRPVRHGQYGAHLNSFHLQKPTTDDSDIGSSPPIQSKPGAQQQDPIAHAERETCPYCKKWVENGKVAKHIRKKHPGKTISMLYLTQHPPSSKEPGVSGEVDTGQKAPGSRLPGKKHRASRRVTISTPSNEEIRRASGLIDNMVGNFRDRDTSSHGGVSFPNANISPPPLSEQMAQDLQMDYVNCPECTKKVKKELLAAHIREVHHVKQRKRKLKDRTISRAKSSVNSKESTLKKITDHEPYGSKHLGHFRRESTGQFGSFPLHDDYSDEAEA